MSRENIFLIGFMSSGKSKIGRQLAKKLNRTFIDLDAAIEKKEGRSISEIFEKEGEEAFRLLETNALKDIEENASLVLALGGGTPCYHDNIQLIKEKGKSIYLKIDEGILIGRLRQDLGKRPLIKDLNNEQVSEFVKTKLQEREEVYLKADHVLEDNNPTPAKLIELLKLS